MYATTQTRKLFENCFLQGCIHRAKHDTFDHYMPRHRREKMKIKGVSKEFPIGKSQWMPRRSKDVSYLDFLL